MEPGTRLFLVNLSRGMCIKNDNGIARAKTTKNFEKFKLESSLKSSNTFKTLRCEAIVITTPIPVTSSTVMIVADQNDVFDKTERNTSSEAILPNFVQADENVMYMCTHIYLFIELCVVVSCVCRL